MNAHYHRLRYGDERWLIPLNEDKKKKEGPTNLSLPQVPMSALFVGATQMGKTHELKHLLKHEYGPPPHENLPGRVFDVLVIISDSGDAEDEYDCFKEGLRVIKAKVEDYSAVIDSIRRQMSKYFKNKHTREYAPQICLILDDCIHTGILGLHNAHSKWLFGVARHYLVNPWVTTQYYKATSNILRTNAALVILFITNDYAEIEKYMESFVSKEFRKNFRHVLLNEIFNKKYNFLAYMPRNFGDDRLMVNLKHRIKFKKHTDHVIEEEIKIK